MIGSTDSHTALATAAEENFFGKHSGKEPDPRTLGPPDLRFQWRKDHGLAAGGIGLRCGLGKGEHPRGDLRRHAAQGDLRHHRLTHDGALLRRLGLHTEDATSRLPADVGYSKGVPMGGDLTSAPAGKSPNFLVAALKDPIGGNLDRIQIVKGWLDADGKAQEKVYDVVWSDDRAARRDGKIPPSATPSSQLRNRHLDQHHRRAGADHRLDRPRLRPQAGAFYYARVIEIPTPRWTAYDALRFGIEMSDDVPMDTQERAYTSPIWYTP